MCLRRWNTQGFDRKSASWKLGTWLSRELDVIPADRFMRKGPRHWPAVASGMIHSILQVEACQLFTSLVHCLWIRLFNGCSHPFRAAVEDTAILEAQFVVVSSLSRRGLLLKLLRCSMVGQSNQSTTSSDAEDLNSIAIMRMQAPEGVSN